MLTIGAVKISAQRIATGDYHAEVQTVGWLVRHGIHLFGTWVPGAVDDEHGNPYQWGQWMLSGIDDLVLTSFNADAVECIVYYEGVYEGNPLPTVTHTLRPNHSVMTSIRAILEGAGIPTTPPSDPA